MMITINSKFKFTKLNSNMKTKSGKPLHVLPHEGGWAVRYEGNKRSKLACSNKVDAVQRARELARKSNSELIIHDKRGRIKEKDSYGNDPFPPSDEK